MLLATDYAPPPVEAITMASQKEVKRAQAADPAITKIVASLQTSNTAKHPPIFFRQEGTQPKGFRDIKTLTHPMHPKVLTTPKVPKMKKKKQKDEWHKSPEVSNDEDPSLQPKSLYDDPKCLQAAVTSAMKSRLTHSSNYLAFPICPFTNWRSGTALSLKRIR
uniref:Testicular haploid expressed protein n=1 Tax=Romanomermis culicivorax TaxID=13658 RepID=A0A915I4H3_ROMCU